MTRDRPVLGILLMLGFCTLAPLGDAMAKLLTQTTPLGLAVFARFAIQAAILVPMVILTRRPWRMGPRILYLTAIRTCLHIAGITLMFKALFYLQLADAIAIAFVMPFIMLLLGKYLLGEQVGPHRLGACIIGFAGTLLVIQPSFAEVGLPALLPLSVAVIFALFMLVTRKLAKATGPISLQAVSGAMATVLMLPFMLLAADPGLSFTMPTGPALWLLLGVGIVGTVAHLLMTWSLRYAPSATLAPMQYLEIPIATVFGWLIFRDLPNGLAAVGICITIGAGLYVILRERASARSAPNESTA